MICLRFSKRRIGMRLKLGLIAAFAGLVAGSMQAQTVIGFHTGTAGPGGDLSYMGGSTPLVGTNIPLGSISLFNTPAHGGTYDLTGPATSFAPGNFGSLNFTTGNLTSYS